ncbi:serine/threonine protein kinase [Plesiocystis pacifica SIR-1]|uniref:non-specific serine/threonine protein kinase n=1 Tax=Plesiocystis pacifica SIR-1 TaxID=391625 RepID=A6GCW3_9BACT|nr:serine/threonine-protein kinase [Plesiocystis pacifica]EDM76287.1 serine/threonine protein kinase [Plesiocystis pacifica SIR-1]
MAAPSKSSPPDPLIGVELSGRYRVEKRLGKGGMGSVYLVEHTTIRKRFAVKVLAKKYANKPDLVQRFLREAQSASAIDHPNVVEISDFGETPTGSVFFVMELFEGEDLRAMLRREKRLAWPRVRHMMMQVCHALEAAHAQGIVHRDMKPDNCFRITRGHDVDFIKVLDFGIAKIEDNDGQGLTRTGVIVGTPTYMAPEQARGEALDHRADIYSVGVIMYGMLCGRPPFKGSNYMETMTAHMFDAPKPPREMAPGAEIPEEVEAIVLKALQKDPGLRFQSMTEMLAALEAVGSGAGAVEVVTEMLEAPTLGPTHYAGRDSQNRPTRPGMSAAEGEATVVEFDARRRAPEDEDEGSGKLLWVGLGGLALSLVAGGALLFMGDPATEAEADAPTPVAAAEPAPAEAAPAPPPVAEPKAKAAPEPGAPSIELVLKTNVEAEILDAADEATYGVATPEGGRIEFSARTRRSPCCSEGYEEQVVEVIPQPRRQAVRVRADQGEGQGRQGQGQGQGQASRDDDQAREAGPRGPQRGQEPLSQVSRGRGAGRGWRRPRR